MKEDSTVIEKSSILAEQLRAKKGGQIVEFEGFSDGKFYMFAIC
jgi:hypothetical protein